MSPEPEFNDNGAVKFKGAAILIAVLAVIMDSPKENDPVPFWVKAPDKLTAVPSARANVPELVTVIGPEFVVVTFVSMTNVLPERVIPDDPEVVISPLNVAVPPIADISNEPAVILSAAVILFAPVMLMALKGVIEPTALLKKIFPEPAFSVIV